jgi:NAD(P)-dependent dehydrogenase (short-subunit alcohol dehydrogenase family)
MRVIAITGGGQGIGRALAWHFADAGYIVAITDKDRAAGREALAGIKERGTDGLFLAGDVSKPAHVARWMNKVVNEFGVPDVLINNAGTMIRKDVLKLSIAEFDSVIAANLRGTFLCAQAAARLMKKRRQGGVIINMASTRAFMSEPNTEGYTASKGGIVALTHGLAISLAPYRIRVNAVAPGWIEVRDWRKSSRAEKPHHSKEDREQHPVGRVGVPEDIAKTCQFLAEDAGFITGQTLVVDGGMTVKMIYAE